MGPKAGMKALKSRKIHYGYWESVAYPGIFFGGVQQIQLRTEDRENGDLGAVAPYSGVLEAAVICYKKFHFI
jgi:hypothetical protein